MVNLMENADHYGGGAPRIAVAAPAARRRRTVEVIVDDAGPGHRPRSAPRCSSASTAGRLGPARHRHRHRLGLALVAEHMRVMHGAVRVESSPAGRGPLRPDPPGAARRRRGRGRTRTRTGGAEARAAVLGVLPRRGPGGAGLRHPDPGRAEHHAAVESAVRPPRPASAHDHRRPSRSPRPTLAVKVFFLNADQPLTAVQRFVAAPAPLTRSSALLLAGPKARIRQGITTAIPSNVTVLGRLDQPAS